MTPTAPWRTLRGRLVLAAVAGLVTAAVVFAAVGAGLIRSQSQAVVVRVPPHPSDEYLQPQGERHRRATLLVVPVG